MNSVPEMAAELAAHPAALEEAARQRSVSRGLVPQYSALPVVNDQPKTGHQITLNIRLDSLLAAIQAQHQARGERFTVAIASRLAFRSLLGARPVALAADPLGYALNMEYVYYSPSGGEYIVEGFATGFGDGPLTGNGWARSCSCPDFLKRRGPAVGQLRGDARCCKHMRLLLLLISQWRGELPWVGRVPAYYQSPGEAFQLQPFG